MALAKQVITLDFGFGGLDQKSDEKLVVRTRMAELYDARFNKAGRVDRRNGQALLGTPPAQSLRLLSNDGALLVVSGAFDASAPFAYRVDSSGGITLPDGHGQTMPAAELFVENVGTFSQTGPSAGTLTFDRADAASMYAVAMTDKNSSSSDVVCVSIRDSASGNLLQSLTPVLGFDPKLVANPAGGNHWAMLISNASASAQLYCFSATYGLTVLTTPAALPVNTASAIVATLDSVTTRYVTPGVPTGLLWFANASSATQITLNSYQFPESASPTRYGALTITGSISNLQHVGLAEVNNRNVTNASGTNYIRLMYHDTGAGKGVFSGVYGEGSTLFAATQATSVTATDVYRLNGISYHTYPTGMIGVGFRDADSLTTRTEIYQFNSSNTPVLLDTVVGMSMISGWAVASNTTASAAGVATSSAAFGWFLYRSDTTQQSAFLMRMSDARLNASESVRCAVVVGRAFYGQNPTPYGASMHHGAPSMQYLGGGNFVTMLSAKQRLSSSFDALTGDTHALYSVRHASTTITKGWLPTSVRDETLITGGYGSFINASEGPLPLAPLLAPNIISVSTTTSGGSMTAGSYAISGVLEYVDKTGRVRRSAPALPVTGTLSGTQCAFIVNYEAYRLPDGLASYGHLRFVPHRTLVNESQVYYRSYSCTATGATPSTTSVLSVSLTIADATIAVEPAMYTVGGVFEDYTPSAPIAIASNGRRCLAVEGDNPTFVLEGKPIVAGYGPSFMQGVGKYVAAGGARIYALASYLDKWFAFKEHGIFVAQGDGADVTGQNDTLSEFQPLVSRFGCTSPRSVVTTANGIVFASVKGFYMIGADLGAQYIGASVEDYTSAVIDAAYDELNDTVYYLLADGTQLVLTFFTTEAGVEPRWSVDQNSGGSSVQVINGLRYLLPTATPSTTPAVYRETAGTYIDANVSTTQVPAFKATSAWVPMGGIQGFGRVYKALVIGTFPAAQAATTVLVRIGFNYSSTYAESHTILSTAMIANGNNVQFEIRPATQKCEAIRFEISQPETTVAGAGLALNQIQLTVGIKSGDNKIAATARAVGS